MGDAGAGSGTQWEGEAQQRERIRLTVLFHCRLARLVAIRRTWQAHMGDTPAPKLLEYAVHSTYLDCVRLGLQAEAWELLGLADGQEGGRS